MDALKRSGGLGALQSGGPKDAGKRTRRFSYDTELDGFSRTDIHRLGWLPVDKCVFAK